MIVETTIVKNRKCTNSTRKALSNEEIQERIKEAESLLLTDSTNDMALPEIKYFTSKINKDNSDISSVVYEAFCFGYCQGYKHNEEREG